MANSAMMKAYDTASANRALRVIIRCDAGSAIYPGSERESRNRGVGVKARDIMQRQARRATAVINVLVFNDAPVEPGRERFDRDASSMVR